MSGKKRLLGNDETIIFVNFGIFPLFLTENYIFGLAKDES